MGSGGSTRFLTKTALASYSLNLILIHNYLMTFQMPVINDVQKS